MGMTTTEQACSTVEDRLSPSALLIEQLEALPVDAAGLQLFQKPLQALKNMLPVLVTRPTALSEHIQNQLTALMDHAQASCPFYREALSQTSDADALQRLRQLPVLRKQDLRHHYTDLWSDCFGQEDLEFWQTSGSTGEPTRFIVDRFSVLSREISFWLSLHISGLGNLSVPEGKTLRLRLSSAEGLTRWVRPLPFENNALLVKLPAFEHPDCDLSQVADFLQAEQPPLLAGNPQGFLALMHFYQHRGESFPYALKQVASGGTVLSAHDRQALEAFFGIAINDTYAMSEVGIIAAQCVHGTRHVLTPFNVLEVVDNQGQPLPDGQLGELVVTSLMNFGFPLLRYQTGDMGRLDHISRCPCGSVLPILYDFQGRKRRFFVTAKGELFSPNALVPMMMTLPLAQYQMVQDTPQSFRLRYRADQPLIAGMLQDLEQRLTKLVGAPITLLLEQVQELQEPGVKYQDFVSYCHPDN